MHERTAVSIARNNMDGTFVSIYFFRERIRIETPKGREKFGNRRLSAAMIP